jgi:hypothetical protein
MPPLIEQTPTEPSWEEAFDEAADWLDERENELDDLTERAVDDPAIISRRLEGAEARLTKLRREMAALEPPLEALRAEVARQEPELFELALAMREQWAALNRSWLSGSIAKAIKKLEGVPTLRWRARPRNQVFDDLRTLFPVWGCTLLSLGNVFPMETGTIERVVIDEAGQCHPAYAVSALYRSERAMIIGDVHQLEPVIELSEAEEARVLRRLNLSKSLEGLAPYRVYDRSGISAQSLAERAVVEVPSLRDHFRCQRQIIEVSSRLCGYDLVVRTPPASLSDQLPLLRGPLVGLRTAGSQTAHIGSWRNQEEVRRVVELVRQMLRSGIRTDQIAVLTPYRSQMRSLEVALRAARIPLDRPEWDDAPLFRDLEPGRPSGGVAVGTLHRFQGGERDVVVLSMVVSRESSLEFTNSRVNLINVAVSRARLHLILVGDPRILAQGKVTGELVRAIPRHAWLG